MTDEDHKGAHFVLRLYGPTSTKIMMGPCTYEQAKEYVAFLMKNPPKDAFGNAWNPFIIVKEVPSS